MFPQQNKRRALQLETSAAEAEPRELRESASFQMKQLLGHIREERQNRADGKRKAQGDQLTTKGWAHFHCKLFSQFHISFLLSFQFRCVSCSSVLVLRIDCCIHGRLLARRKHLQQLKWGKLLSGLLLPFGGTKNFTGKHFKQTSFFWMQYSYWHNYIWLIAALQRWRTTMELHGGDHSQVICNRWMAH